MKFDKKKRNIAFIGGGSNNFGIKLISEMCSANGFSASVKLYDEIYAAAFRNKTIADVFIDNYKKGADVDFEACESIENALKDADFVVVNLSVGSVIEAIYDLALPEDYEVYQALGEKSGPGGIFKALRTVPEYIKLGGLIEKCCPNAWVLTLNEPMAVCLKALTIAFPKVKAIGVTNDLSGAKELFADMLKDNSNEIISKRDIKPNVCGVPGLSFFNDVTFNGDSLFDIYARYAVNYANEGYLPKKDQTKVSPASANMVKFDLFKRYGVIMANDDRQLADSMPGNWYLKSPQYAKSWKITRLTTSYLKALDTASNSKAKKLERGKEIAVFSTETDIINIIDALSGRCNFITDAVMINKGQVSNLPIDSVVHTNVQFGKNTASPLFSGEISEPVLPLVYSSVFRTNSLVNAIFEKSVDGVFNVFLEDPLMQLDMKNAKLLFNEMVMVNKPCLEYFGEDFKK